MTDTADMTMLAATALAKAAGVPCCNDECDRCYPLPWFTVSTERVARTVHSRNIKAATEAEAIAVYHEGTAWPTSYDDSQIELLEQKPTTAVLLVGGDPYRNMCYHDLPSARAAEICARGATAGPPSPVSIRPSRGAMR